MRVFFSIGFIALALSIMAQTDTVKLKEIEVNANRVSCAYNKQLRVVQIIDNNELNKMPTTSLSDLLDYAGSIDVRQRGVNNVQSDISIRGGNYEQLLVMINGIPLNDPQTGHHTMNIPIDVRIIERIEILSGGDARRYGANAFSGAINIVTKNDFDHKLLLSLIGGDFKYLEGQVLGNFKLANTQHVLSLKHNQSNGYRKNTDFNHSQIMWQASQNKENKHLLAMIALEDKAFGANSFYTPKFPDQYEQTRTLFGSLSHKYFWQKNIWTLQTYYRQHHDRFELFRHSLPISTIPSWYKGHNYHMTQVAGGQTNFATNSSFGKTTLGIDYRYEHIYSSVLGEPMGDTIPAPLEKDGKFTKKADKSYWSVFGDHSVQIKKLNVSGGFMITYLSNKEFYYYPGIDIGYNIHSNWMIFSSLSRSLRLPSYTELYYKDPAHKGNINLKPEEAWNYEGGIKYINNIIQLQTAYFYRQGKNIIDWVRLNPSDIWRSENITTVNTSGLEFNFHYNHSTKNSNSLLKQIRFNYSYININKQSDKYYSKYALDVLRHKISFILDHQIIKNLKASWAILYHERMGTYTEFPTGIEKKYTPYITFDGKISYAHKKIELYVSGTNLLNTFYYDIANIPMPGRWVKAGIQIMI